MSLFLALLMLTGPISPSVSYSQDTGEFKKEMESIVKEFKENIGIEGTCSDLTHKSDILSDDIEDYIEDEEGVSEEEREELRDLKLKAESLNEYIGAVGGCESHLLSIEEFGVANSLVNAKVDLYKENRRCPDIIVVTIRNFVSYLAKNEDEEGLTVVYKWRVPRDQIPENSQRYTLKGHRYAGMGDRSYRNMYTNREDDKPSKINIWITSCKRFDR